MKYYFVTDQPHNNWDKVLAIAVPTLEIAQGEQAKKRHIFDNLTAHFLEQRSIPNSVVGIRFQHEIPDDKEGPFIVYSAGEVTTEPMFCSTIQEAMTEKNRRITQIINGREIEENFAWARARLAHEEEKRRVN